MAPVKGSIVPSAVGYETAKTQHCGETGSPASTNPQPSLSLILASGSGFFVYHPRVPAGSPELRLRGRFTE